MAAASPLRSFDNIIPYSLRQHSWSPDPLLGAQMAPRSRSCSPASIVFPPDNTIEQEGRLDPGGKSDSRALMRELARRPLQDVAGMRLNARDESLTPSTSDEDNLELEVAPSALPNSQSKGAPPQGIGEECETSPSS